LLPKGPKDRSSLPTKSATQSRDLGRRAWPARGGPQVQLFGPQPTRSWRRAGPLCIRTSLEVGTSWFVDRRATRRCTTDPFPKEVPSPSFNGTEWSLTFACARARSHPMAGTKVRLPKHTYMDESTYAWSRPRKGSQKDPSPLPSRASSSTLLPMSPKHTRPQQGIWHKY